LPSGTQGQTLTWQTGQNWQATSTLYVSDAGLVGISTSSPAYKLDVFGNARVDGTLKIGGYTLPATDGSTNFVLKTDGLGVVSCH